MSEEIVQPEVVEPVVEQPTSGLPSDNVADDYSGFDLNEDIKGKFKDGKLNGRFSNMNEVLEKLKEAEDFRANTIREQKNNEQTVEKTEAEKQALVEKQQVQNDAVQSMIPTFLENGMELTPEMEAKATEVGIDIRDLKLGALELKDKVTKAHNVVGGAEEYNAMIAWGHENMTDAQKKAFDKDVVNPDLGEYAIKGLYGDYKKAQSGNDTRIEGTSHLRGSVKPYADRRELYKDRDYLSSARGRRDTAAKASYDARLKLTPDSVIFGR